MQAVNRSPSFAASLAARLVSSDWDRSSSGISACHESVMPSIKSRAVFPCFDVAGVGIN